MSEFNEYFGRAQDIVQRGWRKLVYLSAQTLGKQRLRGWGVSYGSGLVLYGAPVVSVAEGASIVLGQRVVLCSWSEYTALGVAHPVVMRALRPGARIVIGSDVGVSGASICSATSVEIGSGTLLGANVMIADTDFHPVTTVGRRYASLSEADTRQVVIGENVFIGANAVVLKGVEIGNNSIIGAASVVVGAVPPNVVAAGNPARVVRRLEPPEDKLRNQ